jgi:hypothetical protein
VEVTFLGKLSSVTIPLLEALLLSLSLGFIKVSLANGDKDDVSSLHLKTKTERTEAPMLMRMSPKR